MRIAFMMMHCNSASGGVRVIFGLANRLRQAGHEVEIWTLQDVPDDLPFEALIPVRKIKVTFDESSQKLEKIQDEHVNDFNPDVYIACSFPFSFARRSLPNARIMWFMQHDETIGLHDVPFSHRKLLQQTFIEATKLPITLLCNSRWVQSTMQSRYGVRPSLLQLGVDTSLFYPDKPLLDIDSNALKIVAIYNGQRWKGLGDLFLSLALLENTHLQCHLILITALPVPELQSSSRLTLVETPAQEDLRRIYCTGDIFLSTSHKEGFGLPGLEAMACGVPVITTDSGGVNEYARHMVNAIIVESGNASKLADAIYTLASDRELQRKLADNGRKIARQLGWERGVLQLESYLSK